MDLKEIRCTKCKGYYVRVDADCHNKPQTVKCVQCGQEFTYVIRHQEVLRPVEQPAETGPAQEVSNGV